MRLHDGTERILAADRIAVFNSEQGLGFDLAYRPGSLKEMLRQMASGNPEETYQPEPMRPEYLDREARLKLMDAQGVERAVVFPLGDGAVRGELRQARARRLRQHPRVQPVVR